MINIFNNKKGLSNILIVGAGVLLMILLTVFIVNQVPKTENPTLSDIQYLFVQGKVTEFTVDQGTGEIILEYNDDEKDEPQEMKAYLAYPSEFMEWAQPYIDRYNKKIDTENETAKSDKKASYMNFDWKKASDSGFWLEWIPSILSFALIGVFIFIFMRGFKDMGMGGKEMMFGKAKVKNSNDEKRKTTFKDVAGADEEKEDLEEIVEFLKSPEKFNSLGGRIPKGVLLVGPPGTGKTLLARAVAGEAGVPFFSISGSDFVEMFVGVGASRVRDLFDQAKKAAPCIIFIDEIDAVGRQRGTGLGGGHDEREQTLNQLLVEMDGFGANEGVIMIAATNRPDVLDPALLRPGRFDRQIVVNYPDAKGREAILKVHCREKPLAPDVKLKTIAKTTAGFTGADLENLLNEAALLAARKNKKAITMAEIEAATIKVVVGTEKKSKVMSDKEKKLTAYHEAGHAIAFHVLESQDPVHQISIIPTGMAGGYTMPLPTEDKSYRSRNEMFDEIVVSLSGRVAEALVMNDISTGASNDIEKATATAKAMVTKYGMTSELGTINYGGSGTEVFIGRDMGQVKDYSEATAAKIDNTVLEIVNNCYKRAEEILNDNITKLHEVAGFLIKYEKMCQDDFEAVMAGTYVEPEEDELKDGEYEC